MSRASERPVTPGRSWPLGVTVCGDAADGAAGGDSAGDAVNVAVWAPEATLVEFCLFDDEGSEERIPLPYRDGEVWHARVPGVSVGTRYGLRADGPNDPGTGRRFNRSKLLIDPYARSLDRPLRWDPLMAGYAAGPDDDLALDRRDSAPAVPKGVVTGAADGPDSSSNRPGHELADLVIYEAHLKGLTATHPDVPDELRGTYTGMAHPAVVEHLVSLGVTAVELLPLQAFFDDQYLVEKGLTNYWGYQPVAWFAPEPRYARADADAELRHLVHTLHEAGIEVIVDVVYNHTGEGDELGPTLSLRGLHNTGYYRLLDDGRHYVNDTGTGNTAAVERPMVLRLVLDSLRHWAERYGIDGFRFDLAAAVGRTGHGFDPFGAFFQAVQQDPVLGGLKLIAEPWDLGPGGYQLGRFPHPWSEWNDRFRDGVRRAWRGHPRWQGDLGARLLGSAHLFEHAGRSTTASVNFITAHDGFTLADLVSYSEKHNEANLEDNRDGHDDNLSDNLGVEGPSDDEGIVSARARRARGMLATLLVSQGVPMLLAGDEIGNGQGGNNNAYAQDNEVGWVDWASRDDGLCDFVRRLVDVRRRLPVLRQRTFLHGRERADGLRDVVWRRADGEEPTAEDWQDPHGGLIAVELRGAAGDPRGEAIDGAVFVIVNVGGDVDVAMPGEAGEGSALRAPVWRLEIDSARPQDEGLVEGGYRVLAQSVVVLSAVSSTSGPGEGRRGAAAPGSL